jgi:hypothetical protein
MIFPFKRTSSFFLSFKKSSMNVQPNQSDPIAPPPIPSAETDADNRIIEELLRRLTPRLIERINQMITDALACKCCG